MSTDNGISQLSFPLTGAPPAQDTLILQDFDVVGVGALRRHQILELQKTKQFILHTHGAYLAPSVQNIYQSELLTTLQWVRPVQTVEVHNFNLSQELQSSFARIFPKTSAALGVAVVKIRDSYLQDMEWSSWLLQDHWRYFVGYLRQKFPDRPALYELAHWEWVRTWMEVQPFESFSGDPWQVILNPSLQIVSLSENHQVLKRDSGLYAFIYDDKKATVVERPLDLYEAKILDILQEDRKYTQAQLLAMVSLSDENHATLDEHEWKKRLVGLFQGAILFEVQLTRSVK